MTTCLFKEDFANPEFGVHFHTYSVPYPIMHDHDYWEFFITLSGKIVHKTMFSTQVLSKNTGGLVHPKDKHCFLSADVPSSQLNLMITDELFHEMLDMIDPSIYDSLAAIDHPIHYYLNEQVMEEISNTLNTLQTINHTNGSSLIGLMKILWMEVIKVIYRNHTSAKHNYPQWLVDFVQTINLPENMNKRVSELATLTPFSYAHLSRLFKKYTGDTLHEYISKIRINYAATLLRTTDKSVLIISGAVGYDSFSHFIKKFKELMGVTPVQYRNSPNSNIDYMQIIYENNLKISKLTQ